MTEVCKCGHKRSRHFTSWDSPKPRTCCVPLCECRCYVEVKK